MGLPTAKSVRSAGQSRRNRDGHVADARRRIHHFGVVWVELPAGDWGERSNTEYMVACAYTRLCSPKVIDIVGERRTIDEFKTVGGVW